MSDIPFSWQKLPKGFLALAPMEDVTDTVFRQIVADCGRPDLMFTEFTSCEGMASEVGHDKVIHRLQYEETERPLIAQIWGKDPDAYYKGTLEVKELGFDGVDINMGCPVNKIVKQGCCSALIDNPTLASEIIKATQEAASDDLPVSVKTRIGFSDVVTQEWCGFLLDHDLAALSIHGRTTKQMSKVPADWGEIRKAVEIRNEKGVDTLIVGNGDVMSIEEAQQRVDETGVDGVMIGRGIFENPWLFNRHEAGRERTTPERLELLVKHVELFGKTWGETKNFAIMKKFFKVYVREFEGAAELRSQLMGLSTAEEIVDRVSKEPQRVQE